MNHQDSGRAASQQPAHPAQLTPLVCGEANSEHNGNAAPLSGDRARSYPTTATVPIAALAAGNAAALSADAGHATPKGCTFPISEQAAQTPMRLDLGLWPVPSEPPGNAGQLVRHIFYSAYLPVPEVAIAAALGLLAGICGRAWATPTDAQLNLYIVLVARSGIGKEHAREAIQDLIGHAAGDHKLLAERVSWVDMASAPALIKSCVANPSFVSMQGEWGHVLKGMAGPRSHEGPMGSLRRAITSLYSNKAPIGLSYSDAEKNVLSEGSVAFSMLAETTPGTFYGALTADMLADGFMSRFTVIEYEGDRPDENTSRLSEPDLRLVELLRTLLVRAAYVMNQMKTAKVKPTEVATSLDSTLFFSHFRTDCNQQIRSAGENEARRQMWNRAHLKALKIASLLAVVDNCLAPEISLDHAMWSVSLVKHDIRVFGNRLAEGAIGDDDVARQDKLLAMCRDYLGPKPPIGYGIPDQMHREAVVPRKYFQIRVGTLSLFKHASGGQIRALDAALKSLVDSGYLMDVDRMKASEAFGFQGKCYRIVNLAHGLTD